MKALRQQIALTAPTNGRVLIYGESGTGKELVARALHASSLREAHAVRGSELRRDTGRTD
jgi:two-component system nitrogen regulation response regulator NtrX